MTDLAVRVENLGKAYRITHQAAGRKYKTLQEDILNLVRRSVRFGRGAEQSEQFWALKDISFELTEGQALGIIGHNGAGKSTLLKILSRITSPTTGFAAVRGRIGSLLEVGTGFHPELTGRENIYLSGAILGMSRADIRRRFDEIVAFAEIAKFLDTPAKRYSSGMYMRLAFSVAAHLEPEILVIDEVLAVGDAEFQKKCLGKMGDVAKSGRTVLFVSHNLAAVTALCSSAILLEHGRIAMMGPSADVVARYANPMALADTGSTFVEDDDKAGYQLIRAQDEIRVICGEPITFAFTVKCPAPVRHATGGLVIYDYLDKPIMGASSKLEQIYGEDEGSCWQITCNLGHLPINAGQYYVSIWFGNEIRDYAVFRNVFSLNVLPGDPFGWGNKVPEAWGYFFWKPEWQIETSHEENQ